MSNKKYGFIGLTGGGTGKLDAIDGSVLTDGDLAEGSDSSQFYAYQLVAASGAAESSPDVISPVTNAGTKRWIRRHDEQKAYRAASPTNGHIASLDADGDLVDSGRATTEVVNYVDRGDPAAVDFTEATLTTDGAAHDIDFSAIVPAGTKAVLLYFSVVDDATGSYIFFRKKGNSNSINVKIVRTQALTVRNDTEAIVFLDANLKAEYQASNVTFTSITVTVSGWFI